jgi:hypothetical protein
MKKIASLVTFTITTRVIHDVNSTDEEIVKKSITSVLNKVENELHENLVDIVPDDECPIGTLNYDIYYQPDFEDPNFDESLFSFEVYSNRENAEADFPNVKILEYSGDDIEDKSFVDIFYLKK